MRQPQDLIRKRPLPPKRRLKSLAVGGLVFSSVAGAIIAAIILAFAFTAVAAWFVMIALGNVHAEYAPVPAFGFRMVFWALFTIRLILPSATKVSKS